MRRVEWRCLRCDQEIVPGAPSPWCLGGRYQCDASRAVPVRIEVPLLPLPLGSLMLLDAPTIPIPVVTPTAQAPTPPTPPRAEPPTPPTGTPGRADDELVAALLARDPVPGRDALKAEFRIGTTKAERVLAQVAARREVKT